MHWGRNQIGLGLSTIEVVFDWLYSNDLAFGTPEEVLCRGRKYLGPRSGISGNTTPIMSLTYHPTKVRGVVPASIVEAKRDGELGHVMQERRGARKRG